MFRHGRYYIFDNAGEVQETMEHRATAKRSPGRSEYIVKCSCGWSTTAIYAYEALGEKRSHLTRAARGEKF